MCMSYGGSRCPRVWWIAGRVLVASSDVGCRAAVVVYGTGIPSPSMLKSMMPLMVNGILVAMEMRPRMSCRDSTSGSVPSNMSISTMSMSMCTVDGTMSTMDIPLLLWIREQLAVWSHCRCIRSMLLEVYP